MPQFDTQLPRGAGDGSRRRSGPAGSALHRPRTPAGRAHAGAPVAHPAGPLRHRRSPLRFPVGPRLPPRVSPALGAAGAFSGCSKDCAHRDGRRAHAPGDRRSAEPARCSPFRQRLRSPEHPLPGRPEEQRAGATPALSGKPPRPRRHRLLPVPAQGRRDGRMAAGGRCARAAIPRRPRRGHPAASPGPLRARGRRRHRGHDRLRHGHRQARRALRRSPGPPEEHRGLLPGDGPRGTGRRACRGVDGLRVAGGGHHARHGREVRSGRGAQAAGSAQARRHARLLRARDLSATHAAGVLRRRPLGGLRQLRQLPHARGGLGRYRGLAEGHVVRPADRTALRRGVPDRCPARPRHRARPALRARQAADVRGRRGSRRLAVALGLSAARCPRPAQRGDGAVRIHPADRCQPGGSARRSRGAHAEGRAARRGPADAEAARGPTAPRSGHVGRSTVGGLAHAPHRTGEGPECTALRHLPRRDASGDGGPAPTHP